MERRGRRIAMRGKGIGEGEWCEPALAATVAHEYKEDASPQIGRCPWRARITKMGDIMSGPKCC